MNESCVRVLLVEDSAADARLVRELLHDTGGAYDVHEVQRLQTAIDRARRESFEVMLLDLTLPDSSGLDTVTAVHRALPRLPIVVMTALEDEQLAAEALKCGAQDYLVKGDVEPALLQRSIRYSISRVETLHHDALTGLPNRASLLDRLARAMGRQRKEGAPHAVLAIELDNYRTITDSLGQAIADEWIRSVVRRMAAKLQPSDTLARTAIDQLVVLVESYADVGALVRLADDFQQELQAPVTIACEQLFSTASIGITISSTAHETPEEHLRDASVAMNRIRAAGGGRHEVFDARMHHQVVHRLQLVTELRRGIERREFRMHYQPIVWLQTGEVAGFEALLRWRHPSRGLLAPGAFLDVAEDAGLLPAISELMFPQILAQLAAWRELCLGRPAPFVNVNLSRAEFVSPALMARMDRALAEQPTPPFSLGVELTESTIIEDAALVIQRVEALRERKIRVLLDDFGTGYSSLSCLHRIPIDALKIDRAFLAEVSTPGAGAEIVRAIVTLAHSMGMGLTAEGIETPAQLSFVAALGCELGQGYYFAKPLEGEAATQALAQGYRQAMASPSLPPRSARDDPGSGRVLLVDAVEVTRRQTRLLLEEQGFEVTEAGSVEECLEQGGKNPQDVILLDLGATTAGGLERCRQINQSADSQGIPILVVTPPGEDELATLEALGAGGQDVVTRDAPTPIWCARLAAQVALSRAQAKLQRMAMTDELTGVFSRRFLFDSFRRAVKATSRRASAGLVCLLADIDRFQQVNATCGHMEGDRLLEQIARTIDDTTRDTDLVARLGGAEFVVLLEDADADEAAVVGENIRGAVERGGGATISVGGAVLPSVPVAVIKKKGAVDLLVERLLRHAGAARDEAKGQGRNRVVISPDPVLAGDE